MHWAELHLQKNEWQSEEIILTGGANRKGEPVLKWYGVLGLCSLKDCYEFHVHVLGVPLARGSSCQWDSIVPFLCNSIRSNCRFVAVPKSHFSAGNASLLCYYCYILILTEAKRISTCMIPYTSLCSQFLSSTVHKLSIYFPTRQSDLYWHSSLSVFCSFYS